MEKTENIAIDENKIRQNQEDDKIRRIAGEYLAKEERDDSLLKTLEDHDGVALKRALKGLLLSSLSLPTYEVTDDRFSRLGAIMERVMGDNRNAMDRRSCQRSSEERSTSALRRIRKRSRS